MGNVKSHKFVNKLAELGLSSEEIAVAVKKTAKSVNEWKRGRHMPKLTPKESSSLCELLDLSIHELAELFEPSDSN